MTTWQELTVDEQEALRSVEDNCRLYVIDTPYIKEHKAFYALDACGLVDYTLNNQSTVYTANITELGREVLAEEEEAGIARSFELLLATENVKMSQTELDAAYDDASRMHTALTGYDDHGQPVTKETVSERLNQQFKESIAKELRETMRDIKAILDTVGSEDDLSQLVRDTRVLIETFDKIEGMLEDGKL